MATRTSAIDKLEPDQRAALEDTAKCITELFGKTEYQFVLKSPESLVVLRGVGYSKKPYIGDDKFMGKRAYLGKSAKVILVFQDLADPGLLMEMPLNDTLTRLGGITTFTKDLQAYREDRDMAAARKEADELEHHAHVAATQARHVENPKFGSW